MGYTGGAGERDPQQAAREAAQRAQLAAETAERARLQEEANRNIPTAVVGGRAK